MGQPLLIGFCRKSLFSEIWPEPSTALGARARVAFGEGGRRRPPLHSRNDYWVGIWMFDTMFEYPLSTLLVSTAVVA